MKKALNILFAAGTLFIVTSCIEDSGTSFETQESNEDERVNPNHIRAYSGLDSIARLVTNSTATIPTNGQLATEMVKVYYKPGQDITDIVEQFNLNETARMGGQTQNTTDATSATDPMEQQSMTTVQDSVNVVTGAKNNADARSDQDKRQGTKTTSGGNSKEQQTGEKNKKQ
ncbi:hypothetical protein ABID22_000621 [Pontibacter aydingkolensis]|uniref:Uncharacterized protein n=1 Tax=Pontibacter aydingkolensis TaxID=1911536 RepID=A0ABS7CRN8_9BACT|nr:hypothetical protein [Pontibacter aydingkolensis]MBW7466503.1 hypothetical protein [Pontibacter aydingkolensis]